MHRFQDKVVVFTRLDLFDERLSRRLGSDTVIEELIHIRPPLTEIVIYVDRRHPGRIGAFLEASEPEPANGAEAERTP